MSEQTQELELDSGPMMSLIEHMIELKDHLVRIAISLVVSSAGTFVLAKKIL